MLVKGSTAMAGRSGSGNAARVLVAASLTLPSSPAGASARDVADEAEALARNGADQLLLFATVADRLARGVDPAGQGRVRHDAAAPDRSDEIVLADDVVAAFDQIDQQVEHLRLDGNRLGAAAQLPPVGVKPMIRKEKLHLTVLAPADRRPQR